MKNEHATCEGHSAMNKGSGFRRRRVELSDAVLTGEGGQRALQTGGRRGKGE